MKKNHILFIFFCLFLILFYIFYKYKHNKNVIVKNNDTDDIIVNIQDDFLTNQECDELIEIAKSKLKPSTVIIKNGTAVDNNARTSYTAAFKRKENIIIENIENKICKILNIKNKQLEPIQISKYVEGQQYKYHYDYFNTKLNKILNQRQYTILIYLTDVANENGGCTNFYYGDSYQPIKGRMIQWSNLNENNEPNNKTLHCGKPVKNGGEKYILTIWTRLNEY